MKTAFAIMLIIVLSGTSVVPAQLNQITACVEAPSSVVTGTSTRFSTRSDCDPDTAFARARDKARSDARDGIAPTCEDEISTAEAEEICRASGGSLPSGSTSLSGDRIAGAGFDPVFFALPISQSSPKICAVIRNVPNSTVTTTESAGWENGWCVANGGRVTSKKVFAKARCGVQCFNTHHHQLTVRRFTSATVSGNAADRILADSTLALQTDEGSSDISCAVALSRIDVIETFSTGDGSIDSSSEFNAIADLSGNVKVVNAINWCGSIAPNTVGCTPRGSTTLIVERLTQTQREGSLWAHEFGHAQDLLDTTVTDAIMNGTLSSDTQRKVNSSECGSYQDELGMIGMNAASRGMGVQARAESRGGLQWILASFQTEKKSPADIKEFVRQTFIHGVPYEKASKYSPEVVPILLEMLKDKAEEAHWANVVVVLGMIGDERALDSMIAFVEREPGKISPAHYRAKTVAITSIGYLINKSGSKKGLDYLKLAVNPGIWAAKAGENLAPYQVTKSERNNDFAKYAILGLALSGHPDAGDTLRSLQQRTTNKMQQNFRTKESKLVIEMLAEHQKIASLGLAAYYHKK